MVVSINNILSSEDIDYLLNMPEVLNAKNNIDNNTLGSIYFTINLTESIKNTIYQKMDLNLSNIDKIPMRWIKGDTLPHIDKGIKSFENTYLIYLTDSSGELIVDNESYPISQNNAYIFNEGLDHKTINTGLEPRLLLGPMSEQAFAVGGGTFISAPGGTNVYIRFIEGVGLQYKYENIDEWFGFSTPISVENTDTAAGFLKLIFTTNISLFTQGSHFICNTDKIQFGSESLNNDGTRPIIAIDSTLEYPGLIQNFNGDNGYNDIYIFNLDVINVGSTLADSAGWIGGISFGTNATNNYIINCCSNGNISESGGGIVGEFAAATNGTLTIIGCSSSGSMSSQAGGIVGHQAGNNGGTININSCWSTGSINSDGAGGIVGANCESVTITNCYSTGVISGNNSGGIIGANAGIDLASITNCYSTGNITGGNAGGICGSVASDLGIHTVSISNCYSTGNVTGLAGGGICGILVTIDSGTLNITINNCYTSGTIDGITGYIIGNVNVVNGTNADPLYNLSNNYSEAGSGGSPGNWITSNANNVLTGFPLTGYIGTVWFSTTGGTGPYELKNMGYTPYDVTNISGTPPNLIRTDTLTVAKSETSTAGIKDAFYAIINIVEDYNGITINPANGAISTTTSTAIGTYTIYVYNTGSYHITTLTLTVGDLPCLTEDTTVLTPNGYVNINTLHKGDNVITSDNRIVEIVKIYKSRVIASDKTYPCIIPKNSIAPNYPPETFKISQGHLIKYNSSKNYWIYPRLYFPLDKSIKLIKYYHIKLENYITDHLVINNGVVVESLGNHPSDNYCNDNHYNDYKKESLRRLRNKCPNIKKIKNEVKLIK